MFIACKKHYLVLLIFGGFGFYMQHVYAMRWCCGAAAVTPALIKTPSVEAEVVVVSDIDEVIFKEVASLATSLIEKPDSVGLPRVFVGEAGIVKHEESFPAFLKRVSSYIIKYKNTGYISRQYGRLLQPAIVIDDFEKVCAAKTGMNVLVGIYNVACRSGCCDWIFLVKRHKKDIDLDFFKRQLADVSAHIGAEEQVYLQQAELVYCPDDVAVDDAAAFRHWHVDLMKAFQREYWFWLLKWNERNDLVIDDYP